MGRIDVVGSDITDITRVETTMSPDVVGSAAATRNLDIETTITFQTPIMPHERNLRSSVHTIAWSAPSQDPPEQGA